MKGIMDFKILRVVHPRSTDITDSFYPNINDVSPQDLIKRLRKTGIEISNLHSLKRIFVEQLNQGSWIPLEMKTNGQTIILGYQLQTENYPRHESAKVSLESLSEKHEDHDTLNGKGNKFEKGIMCRIEIIG